MLKNAKRFLVLSGAIVLLAIGSTAQVRQADLSREDTQIQAMLARASESAKFENGRIKSLRIQLPNFSERLVTFEYAGDDRSFTMVDAGRRITVLLDKDRRISAVIFPNGKRAEFSWTRAANGYWVPASIKVDGRDIRQCNSLVEDCSEVCERAAALTVIAIGVCATTGPTVACWSSTASAGLATYYCYRCAYPQIEEPPVN
jgi:hypothetical protein